MYSRANHEPPIGTWQHVVQVTRYGMFPSFNKGWRDCWMREHGRPFVRWDREMCAFVRVTFVPGPAPNRVEVYEPSQEDLVATDWSTEEG